MSAAREALIAAREARGMSRQELAEILGVGRTWIYKIETGTRDPSIELMMRWTSALKATSRIWTDQDAERVNRQVKAGRLVLRKARAA